MGNDILDPEWSARLCLYGAESLFECYALLPICKAFYGVGIVEQFHGRETGCRRGKRFLVGHSGSPASHVDPQRWSFGRCEERHAGRISEIFYTKMRDTLCFLCDLLWIDSELRHMIPWTCRIPVVSIDGTLTRQLSSMNVGIYVSTR